MQIESPFDCRDDLNAKIALWKGDLVALEVDAIVNTTNERLIDRSGLANRIHHYAGPGLAEECKVDLKSPLFILTSEHL